jgi:hypothetical protein
VPEFDRESDTIERAAAVVNLLTQSGVQERDLPQALRGVWKLVEAAQVSDESAARSVSIVLAAFGLTRTTAAGIADTLVPDRPKHGAGYTFTCIEATIQALSIRGLTITPQDVLDGLRALHRAGIVGSDAERALHVFLMRLTPAAAYFVPRRRTMSIFIGWPAMGSVLRTMSDEDLFTEFGSDATRVAAVIRATHE